MAELMGSRKKCIDGSAATGLESGDTHDNVRIVRQPIAAQKKE